MGFGCRDVLGGEEREVRRGNEILDGGMSSYEVLSLSSQR